jgi:hypothetical protein
MSMMVPGASAPPSWVKNAFAVPFCARNDAAPPGGLSGAAGKPGAVTVTVTVGCGETFCGVHVPENTAEDVPTGVRLNGMSPFENEAATCALVNDAPGCSTRRWRRSDTWRVNRCLRSGRLHNKRHIHGPHGGAGECVTHPAAIHARG